MGPSAAYGLLERTVLGPEKGVQPLPPRGRGRRGRAALTSGSAGRSRGAIISQYYNRTMRLRRRTSRPQLADLGRSARPSLRLYDLELDSAALQEEGE